MQSDGLQQRSGETVGTPREGVRADATDGNPLGLGELSSPSSPKPLQWLGMFAVALIALSMVAAFAVVTIARDKKASRLYAEENRLQESVLGRIDILQTWLEGQISASRRLTESRVFRLFIADLVVQDLTLPLPPSLRDQRPYFRQVMADFARQNDLVRAAILRDDGAVLLSSPGPALAVNELLRRRDETEARDRIRLSPIRQVGDGDWRFVVDALLAFPEAQTEGGATSPTRAFLALTLPIEAILEKTLSNKLADHQRERIVLLQRRGDLVDRLQMTRKGVELSTVARSDDISPGTSIAFARRDDEFPIYALGEPVGDLPWTLYHALDASAVLSPARTFVRNAAGFSLMAALALAAAFAALWWRQERNHHRELVDSYRAHAEKADRQRQFLQSVTTSIRDWLMVSSADGQLLYTNPAFEAVVGQSKSSITGCSWDDFVKKPSDEEDLRGDLLALIDASPFDIVDVAGERRIISSDVSDLKSEDGRIEGAVRIVRDHTEVVAARQRRLSSLVQTVDALVQAIELRDPFLVGHTKRVRVHVIAMGKRLGLPTDELARLALAASLSQLGKIFVPDDILTKPDRHSPEEEQVMRRHIFHAVDILKRVDFERPIVDVLLQMHERLDGSGYPHGIAGDEISLGARILAVADVFCARTAPRSYRDRLGTGKALYHLADNGRRYDLKVVAALTEIVGQGQEIGDVGGIEKTFLDTAIWQPKRVERGRAHEPAWNLS
ncbi:MAG: HD domain-containing phosphohydrolase [Alphaproteobacteria bacterium]